MTNRFRPGVALAASGLAVSAGLLSGCSLISGPLSMGGPESSSTCVPAEAGHHLLVGDFFTAPANTDAVIRSVDLVEPKGIELQQAWIAQPGDLAFGSAEYPPSDGNSTWDGRVDADGAEAFDGDNNVILLLRRTGTTQGSAAAVEVHYSSGGTDYTIHGSMSIAMKDQCFEPEPTPTPSPTASG